MSSGRGKNVGPPVPCRRQQQNRDENGVRRKEKRHFAIGKAKSPRDPRRSIVSDGRQENLERDPDECRKSFLLDGAHSMPAKDRPAIGSVAWAATRILRESRP